MDWNGNLRIPPPFGNSRPENSFSFLYNYNYDQFQGKHYYYYYSKSSSSSIFFLPFSKKMLYLQLVRLKAEPL